MRHSKHMCPRYQAAIDILGKRWTGLILNVLMAGPQRFSELLERLDVVSDRMLSERLKELEATGIVDRKVLPDPPIRVEYRLTDKGRALGPVLKSIGEWAERWIQLDPAAAAGE